MAQDFYENWKKSATGRKVLLTWVRDPEGLLTGNGHFEGVYEFVRWRVHRFAGFKEVDSGHDAHRTRINFEGEVSKSFSLRRLLPLRHISFDCP